MVSLQISELNIVSLLCSSLLATGFPVLVPANTEPSNFKDYVFHVKKETTGFDVLCCIGLPSVALFSLD